MLTGIASSFSYFPAIMTPVTTIIALFSLYISTFGSLALGAPLVNKTYESLPEAKLYMESLCTDTTYFTKYRLLELFKYAGGRNKLRLTYIPYGKARCSRNSTAGEPDDYECQCQHREEECIMNAFMNCAISELRNPQIKPEEIICMQGKRDPYSAAKDCFAESVGRQITNCTFSRQGRRLLANAGVETDRFQRPLKFVPTIAFDDGEEHYQLFGWMFDHVKEALCSKIWPKSQACLDEGF